MRLTLKLSTLWGLAFCSCAGLYGFQALGISRIEWRDSLTMMIGITTFVLAVSAVTVITALTPPAQNEPRDNLPG